MIESWSQNDGSCEQLHYTQNNNIQHNDTQHDQQSALVHTTFYNNKLNILSVIMRQVFYHCALRGTKVWFKLKTQPKQL
jgi:hypothetical protein